MAHLSSRRFLLLLVLFTAPLPLTGCSRFESDWRSQAVARSASEAQQAGDQLSGRWKGSWKSRANGHSGSLRCIMTRVDDDTYRAQFHATFGLVFQFDYTVNMDVRRENEVTYFGGKADLGRMAGGVYSYDGHADGTVFHSTYRSGNDHGYFRMKRPQ